MVMITSKLLHSLTHGAGLLSKIFSIFSSISGVILGITSSAFRLSVTCSGFDAPRMTVLVLGLAATQASARCVTLHPSSDQCGSRNQGRWKGHNQIKLSIQTAGSHGIALMQERQDAGHRNGQGRPGVGT